MKSIFLALALLSLSAGPLSGDHILKVNSRWDSYYNYGVTIPAVAAVTEYWVGPKRIARRTDRGKIVMDAAQNRILFINFADRTFVEVDLSRPLSEYIAEETLKTYATDRAGGEIRADDQERTIGPRSCRAWTMRLWMEDQESRLEEKEETLWMASDLPFDSKLFQRLQSVTFDIYQFVGHWERSFVAGLKEIPGFPVLRETVQYIKGIPRRASHVLTELTEAEPPPDAYSVPEGFQKNNKLGPSYFNPFPYHNDWGILRF